MASNIVRYALDSAPPLLLAGTPTTEKTLGYKALLENWLLEITPLVLQSILQWQYKYNTISYFEKEGQSSVFHMVSNEF